MFPFDLEELEEGEELEEEVYKEYGIDFETGQLNGTIVEDEEAVKVWAYLALRTPRYRFQQYSWNYGSDIEDEIIGQGYSKELIDSEMKSLIEECLMIHPHIAGVSNFRIEHESSKLVCRFKIVTDFGDIEEEFNQDV